MGEREKQHLTCCLNGESKGERRGRINIGGFNNTTHTHTPGQDHALTSKFRNNPRVHEYPIDLSNLSTLASPGLIPHLPKANRCFNLQFAERRSITGDLHSILSGPHVPRTRASCPAKCWGGSAVQAIKTPIPQRRRCKASICSGFFLPCLVFKGTYHYWKYFDFFPGA